MWKSCPQKPISIQILILRAEWIWYFTLWWYVYIECCNNSYDILKWLKSLMAKCRKDYSFSLQLTLCKICVSENQLLCCCVPMRFKHFLTSGFWSKQNAIFAVLAIYHSIRPKYPQIFDRSVFALWHVIDILNMILKRSLYKILHCKHTVIDWDSGRRCCRLIWRP